MKTSGNRNDENDLMMSNGICLKDINLLCGTWLCCKKRKVAFSQGFIRVFRLARQALGPMKESGRRGSPKTSTRSDEEIWEATISEDKH